MGRKLVLAEDAVTGQIVGQSVIFTGIERRKSLRLDSSPPQVNRAAQNSLHRNGEEAHHPSGMTSKPHDESVKQAARRHQPLKAKRIIDTVKTHRYGGRCGRIQMVSRWLTL
jgi:hypothetical protein